MVKCWWWYYPVHPLGQHPHPWGVVAKPLANMRMISNMEHISKNLKSWISFMEIKALVYFHIFATFKGRVLLASISVAPSQRTVFRDFLLTLSSGGGASYSTHKHCAHHPCITQHFGLYQIRGFDGLCYQRIIDLDVCLICYDLIT